MNQSGKSYLMMKVIEYQGLLALNDHFLEIIGISKNQVPTSVFVAVSLYLIRVQNMIQVVDGQVSLYLQMKNQ